MSFILSPGDHQPTDVVVMETAKQRKAPARMRARHKKLPGSRPGARALGVHPAAQASRGWRGGWGVRDMLGRRARPALPPTLICLGVPEGGRGVPGAAQGARSCPRRGHRNLHPLVSGVGGTRATRVFSKGDLTRGEARPRTKGLSYSLGHTHFNPLGFQYGRVGEIPRARLLFSAPHALSLSPQKKNDLDVIAYVSSATHCAKRSIHYTHSPNKGMSYAPFISTPSQG